jgi:hypothetical protein
MQLPGSLFLLGMEILSNLANGQDCGIHACLTGLELSRALMILGHVSRWTDVSAARLRENLSFNSGIHRALRICDSDPCLVRSISVAFIAFFLSRPCLRMVADFFVFTDCITFPDHALRSVNSSEI